VKRPEARRFYETEALRAGWSVRQLDRQIDSQFYERIALSRNKAAMLEKAEYAEPSDAITPEEAIKDPFVLEFLNLKDEYSESELEDALIRHLADFLLELCDDFTFLGRQRRLRLDDTWFRIDLIFFHRRLRCLVIIDLKVGKFGHADAGQMHLYLNYAREHWMKPGENPPVGLILCTQKGVAEARYALDNLPNKVLAAEYQTVLPDAKLLEEEVEKSQARLGSASTGFQARIIPPKIEIAPVTMNMLRIAYIVCSAKTAACAAWYWYHISRAAQHPQSATHQTLRSAMCQSFILECSRECLPNSGCPYRSVAAQ